MKIWDAKYFSKKGQVKIQEMAFVLIGLMVFFGIVIVLYLSIRTSSLKEDVSTLREDAARELVRKLASTPEFSWNLESCSNCMDFDKVYAMKVVDKYGPFWKLDYLKVEKVYPKDEGECTSLTYPRCGSITLVNKSENYGIPVYSYVALCRQEKYGDAWNKRCELGKIYASWDVAK